ncbi:MAG: hypothetical protein ACTSV9_06260 [Candidatus Thorarchaeota archaeon]
MPNNGHHTIDLIKITKIPQSYRTKESNSKGETQSKQKHPEGREGKEKQNKSDRKTPISVKDPFKGVWQLQREKAAISQKTNSESKEPLRSKKKETEETLEEEIHRLYFNEGLTQEAVATKIGMARSSVQKIFKENEWEGRRSRRTTDVDELKRLYYEEGLTQEEVAKKLGIASRTVAKIFSDYELQPVYTLKVDIEELRKLYYEKKLSHEDIAKQLDVSKRTIGRMIKNHGLEVRDNRKYQTEEQKKEARGKSAEQTREKVRKLREELWGENCLICKVSNKEKSYSLHKRDGTEHNPDDLWKLKYLKIVNPNEYSPLCVSCHRGTHYLMKNQNMQMDEIESRIPEIPAQKTQDLPPIERPNDLTPSSKQYDEIKPNFKGTTQEMVRALFGETCVSCGLHYEKKQSITHRKDGRPHHPKLTSEEKYFRTLDPDEWATLCKKCHRYVHWSMDELEMNWADFNFS